MKWILIILIALAACGEEETRPARATYNQALAKLAGTDFEGAETALMEARSAAGVDPELRFRAAYNLGLAYAGHAEKIKSGEKPDLKHALELAQQAAWWFGDAARLRPTDKATADNLAILRARVQALSDELRKNEGKLEVRLDALIAQQREILERSRATWREVEKAKGLDPLAQKDVMLGLADRSRGIVAEAGVIQDVAADEIDVIAKKAEDQRDDKERSRLVQLKNLDGYIGEARARIAETRRELQEISADTALAKAEAALVALKRAREQLDDPITVLQHVLQDQAELDRQIQLAADGSKDKWLEEGPLAGRQSGLKDRVEQVKTMLDAAASAPVPPDAPPEQARTMARVKEALPHLATAMSAQQAVHTTVLEKQWQPAREHVRNATLALFAAIELFADLKRTVDLAWQKHQVLQQLLIAPPTEDTTPQERAKQVHDELAANLGRIERVKTLIAEQLAEAMAKPVDPNADDQAKAAHEQAQQQAQAQLARAEELRALAATQLAAVEAAIAKPEGGSPIDAARTADATLYELRKLFFDVVEHLQELVREQGETRERTQTAGGMDDLTRETLLPELVGRQDGHGQMAKAITDALAAQADAMSQQAAAAPEAEAKAKAMREAAAEVRLGGNDMSDAKATLDKAAAPKTQSVSLDPATSSQGTAIEHLIKALQLLQPPPPPQEQEPEDKQDKQDKQPPKPDEKPPEQQQQSGAGQRAREDDAKRQKEKREQPPVADPVEQDW